VGQNQILILIHFVRIFGTEASLGCKRELCNAIIEFLGRNFLRDCLIRVRRNRSWRNRYRVNHFREVPSSTGLRNGLEFCSSILGLRRLAISLKRTEFLANLFICRSNYLGAAVRTSRFFRRLIGTSDLLPQLGGIRFQLALGYGRPGDITFAARC
jgi:hypothetical protein